MTFLKKLGSILLQATEMWAGFAPVITQTLPGASGPIAVVSKDMAAIAQIVVEAEAMGQALAQPGTAKLAAAAPLVAQIVLQSSIMADRKIADPALFNKGCGELAGAMADILNSLHDNIDTTSKS